MFVREDFKHLSIKPNSKLQLFPTKATRLQELHGGTQKFELGYFQHFKHFSNEFIQYFSVHGVNRIFERNLNIYKRITWIVGFLVCLLMCIYVSYRVSHRFHTKPLHTVVSVTHYPVFRIPFPEVTICNMNRFNWQRFNMAKHLFLKTRHQIIPQYQQIFLEVVNALDTMSFGKFNKFENLSKIPPSELQELNYVNFHLVSEFMAWKCHEIFSLCEWLDDDYSCCDIFFMRKSQSGSCLAFNTVESSEGLDKQRVDSFWPWRTKDKGPNNGLGVRIHIREQDHSPWSKNKKGILVMINEPQVWYSTPIDVDTHTRTSISIKGFLHTHSNYTRLIPSKVRKCLFKDELNNRHYKSLPNRDFMFENCRSQCQQEYLVKHCNCTASDFYPHGPYRPCKLVDFPCLFYHNDKFQHFMRSGESEYIHKNLSDSMNCPCLYNCESLNYVTTITSAYMSNREVDLNNSYIDLQVFFQKEYITILLTTVTYTMTDLMASFGGLAGLCIGSSLLSLVEIVYFFFVDVPNKTHSYFKKRNLSRLQRKSHGVKVNMMRNFLENSNT